MEEQKVYVLIDNSHESDDYWNSDGEIIFISLDYAKAKAELDKYRHEVETWDPSEHFNFEVEINKLTDTTVSYYCGKWTYEYELGEYPLDTDIRLYSYKHRYDN